jgi:prevent-host-death family protein
MSDTVPVTDAKAHLSDLVDRVEHEHERILVTRNGLPAAVLISPDDLDSLEETIEILHDRELMKSLRISRAEAAAGERIPLRDPRDEHV